MYKFSGCSGFGIEPADLPSALTPATKADVAAIMSMENKEEKLLYVIAGGVGAILLLELWEQFGRRR